MTGGSRLAIETKTTIKPIKFIDTYDIIHYKSLFMLNPRKCRVVFLDEINVREFLPDDIQILKQKVYGQMESALINYKPKWVDETAKIRLGEQVTI
ncbi:MAG TPA: hypothetical protein VKR53_21605 [Puia sp.]|nr:hypothetical protein [Puia sp.]